MESAPRNGPLDPWFDVHSWGVRSMMVLGKLLGRQPATGRPGASGIDGIPLGGGLFSVKVADPQARPFSGAEIEVLDRLGRTLAHGEADTYGFFAATLPGGEHRFIVHAGGYQRRVIPFEVQAGRHTTLDTVTLRPDEEMALPEQGEWLIDQDHSSIRFVARHIGLSRVHGQFAGFHGRIKVGKRMEDSEVEVTMDAASITTGNTQRDAHLRSPDFLDVARYPRLHFVSSQFGYLRGDHWVIKGSLTIRGVTGTALLDTRYLGLQEWNGSRTAICASTELHREDYTLNYRQLLGKGINVIGSTIKIELDVQAIRQ
ncbi:hypothetical protein D5S17_33560 [Pseudonocardiaceae bacterium YIM PH 21723]|nr:hypothetical protein D5S17_33560 [Pseudonocardiaceae bacterium YIM PH 21723]